MSDLDARLFRRRDNMLVPVDRYAHEWLCTIDGRPVMVSVRRPRNPEHHRLLFALLRTVVDATGKWPDVKTLLHDLKMATGLTETHINGITGEIVVRPQSISFAAMDQQRFRPWFDRATFLISAEVLDMPQSRLISMLEPRYEQEMRHVRVA